MKFIDLPLGGSCFVEPVKYKDDRGEFFESWNVEKLSELGVRRFVQKNVSTSRFGVLRGLHFQRGSPQGKLVQVLKGEVQDVIVDLRRSSTTFGEWFSVRLRENSGRALWVPKGCAHGFLALSSTVEFCYYVTDYYNPSDEVTLRYDDDLLRIPWEIADESLVVSEKDRVGLSFSEVNYFD